jgi:1-acyl-sn-glycerol-3-phosphate acyltransferase
VSITNHSEDSLINKLDDSLGSQIMVQESSTRKHSLFIGKIYYWWSFFVAAILLLFIGVPILTIAWIVRQPSLVYPGARFGARSWLRLSGVKVRVAGGDHIDPNQTYVFISNHRSYLDTATLFNYAMPRMGMLAKKELLKIPVLGQGMHTVNIMAIDRSNRERAIKTVRAATEKIKSGVSFGVFAEGTRAKPGQLLPFKKGAFYMAIEAGVPIVPVAMKNTDKLMGKGTGILRPGTIEMVILEPIPTIGLSTDEDVRGLIDLVHDRIEKELNR